MKEKRSTRRRFLGLAASGGALAFVKPGRSSAPVRSAGVPLQEDRPIIVRGGSVEIEFDEGTYTGGNGTYRAVKRQIAGVTFTRPNGSVATCAGDGPVRVRCTNPQTTITIQNSGSDLSIVFDEKIFPGTPGSGRRRNANARLRDLQNGTATCSPGTVSTITILTR